jgi:hypothetical protein
MRRSRARLLTTAVIAGLLPAPWAAQAAPYVFQTVANIGDTMPPSSRTFNSFNQPSINATCLLVFRGRSRGEQQPVRGIYTRQACGSLGPIKKVAAVGDKVPAPNNTNAVFNEFPAFPRIQLKGEWVATRGQTRPVWEYTLPDGSDTRVGTAGIFAESNGGALKTGEALLGAVPEFSQFAVPGTVPGTRFDQFPGAPSPTSGKFVVFKGNYTEGGASKTGVFFRNVIDSAGTLPTRLVANSSIAIPGTSVNFGSTAPPSAANGSLVFLGVDNEDLPTVGGIYSAPLRYRPALTRRIAIGGPVLGVAGATFSRLGEGLSYEGRFIGFWGAWGTATRTVHLVCPTDGNPDLIAACEDETVQVPANQGIFVHDIKTGTTRLIARTGTAYKDFQFWVFSGRPPGVGDSEDAEEPARWRASSFVAVNNKDGVAVTAFKALTPADLQGIYIRATPTAAIRTLLITGSDARKVDVEAPAGSSVTALGIERDGFRGCKLALNMSALNPVTSESWAGVYVVRAGACTTG